MMTHRNVVLSLTAALLALASAPARASTVTLPNTFTAGTTAKAGEVNANFTAVKTSVDDNASKIGTLQTSTTANSSAITTLQTSTSANASAITTLQTTTGDNTSRIAALEADPGTMRAWLGAMNNVCETYFRAAGLPAGFKTYFIAAAGKTGNTATGDQVCAGVASPWSWMFGDANGYGRCAGMFPSQALQTNSTVNNGTATYSESGTGFLAGACSTRTVVPVSGASGSAWADLSHPGWIACCY